MSRFTRWIRSLFPHEEEFGYIEWAKMPTEVIVPPRFTGVQPDAPWPRSNGKPKPRKGRAKSISVPRRKKSKVKSVSAMRTPA